MCIFWTVGNEQCPVDTIFKSSIETQFCTFIFAISKVFKLYTGYNLHGHMTPVLVFLTDKTLYVTDLVRNRLCNKYVLPYTELDVILVSI